MTMLSNLRVHIKIVIFIFWYTFIAALPASRALAQFYIGPGGFVTVKQSGSLYLDTDVEIKSIAGSSGALADQNPVGVEPCVVQAAVAVRAQERHVAVLIAVASHLLERLPRRLERHAPPPAQPRRASPFPSGRGCRRCRSHRPALRGSAPGSGRTGRHPGRSGTAHRRRHVVRRRQPPVRRGSIRGSSAAWPSGRPTPRSPH